MSFAQVRAKDYTQRTFAPLEGWGHLPEPEHRHRYGYMTKVGGCTLSWACDDQLTACKLCQNPARNGEYSHCDIRTGMPIHGAIALCGLCDYVMDQSIADETHTWVVNRSDQITMLHNDDVDYADKFVLAARTITTSCMSRITVKSSLGSDIFWLRSDEDDMYKVILQKYDSPERQAIYILSNRSQSRSFSARDGNTIASASNALSSTIYINDLRIPDRYAQRMEWPSAAQATNTAFVSEHLLATASKHTIRYYDIRASETPALEFDLGADICVDLV